MKVLVGMSGGVDSSVSAYLLQKEGYEVIGATMVLFDSDSTKKSIEDAKKVCEKLGIKHYTINYKDEFKKEVIDNFINSYKNGLTPNPCVICNKKFKFGLLYEKAKELNCDFIATGHYANVIDNKLIRVNNAKDQTYFLYNINKEVLPHILFPLNKFDTKDEIKKIAYDNNLVEETLKESQEICFVPNDDYAKYLEDNMEEEPKKGKFILKNTGQILGSHKGIMYYTIGQRKGLGISYEKPLYVKEIDVNNNIIYLGMEEDLYNREVIINNINLLQDELPNKVQAKIRYRSPLSNATIEKINNDEIKVIFDEPQKSITPGQSLVMYDNDVCLGGGIISKIV